MTTSMKEGLGAVDFETAFMRKLTPSTTDFDILGHVNNTVYVRWVQEIATEHWNTVTPDEMRAAYIFIVLRHEISYRDPVLPDEDIEIRTWLGEARGPRFDRYVDIRKPNAKRPSAEALTTWCMLDAETRRPKKVGDDVLKAFKVSGRI